MAFRVLFRHVVGDPAHLLTVKVNHLCGDVFIAPPVNQSVFVRSSFGLPAVTPACCLFWLISSWVHLSPWSLAGLKSTLPDQKLSGMPSGTARTCRGGYVRRSRIRRISLAHPAKFGFLADGAMVFTMSTSTLRRSGLAVPHCRSELQHPVSPQEDLSGWSEDSPEFSDEKGFILSFVSLSFVFT